MGGSGSMQHAANQVKNLKSRRDKIQQKRKRNLSHKSVKTEYDFAKPTEKELEIVKAKFKKKIKTRQKKEIFLAVILTFIFFWLLYFFLK